MLGGGGGGQSSIFIFLNSKIPHIATNLRACKYILELHFDAHTSTFVMHINSTIYFGYQHRLQNANVQYSCFFYKSQAPDFKYIILITKTYASYSYQKTTQVGVYFIMR